LHFLRKFDGTLLQRFQRDGRVYFTTRGMIEGGPCYGAQDEDAAARSGEPAGVPPCPLLSRLKGSTSSEPRGGSRGSATRRSSNRARSSRTSRSCSSSFTPRRG